MVNGDDFGLNRQMNHGILDAARRGILTQATLLLGQPGTTRAILMARRHNLPLGLHLNITIGSPSAALDKIPSLVKNGQFYNVAYYTKPDWERFVAPISPQEVTIELAAQVSLFTKLVGKPPTHMDSHEVLSGHPKLLPAYLSLAQKTRIPMRRPVWYREPHVRNRANTFFKPLPKTILPKTVPTTDRVIFMSDVRLGGVESLVSLLKSLPTGRTALVTHPAHKNLPIKKEIAMRNVDHELLIHPEVQKTIQKEGIRLSTFEREFVA